MGTFCQCTDNAAFVNILTSAECQMALATSTCQLQDALLCWQQQFQNMPCFNLAILERFFA